MYISLRVQVPNNHILTQSLYYNPYYPKPKYLIIRYLDPLGICVYIYVYAASYDASSPKATTLYSGKGRHITSFLFDCSPYSAEYFHGILVNLLWDIGFGVTGFGVLGF